MRYLDLIASYKYTPRNVHTVPTDGRVPKCFWVSVERDNLYVSAGTTPYENSNVRGKRLLSIVEMETMLSLYQRRKKGEAVSREASRVTQNQVYWYGIFNDLGM